MSKTAQSWVDGFLGRSVKDASRGMIGRVTCVSFDLYGCIQAVVSPPSDDGRTLPSPNYMDIARLRHVEDTSVVRNGDVDVVALIQMLGKQASCLVTGFSGTITSVSAEAFGGAQVCIQPPVKDGESELPGGKWTQVKAVQVSMDSESPIAVPDFDIGYVADGKKGPAEKLVSEPVK